MHVRFTTSIRSRSMRTSIRTQAQMRVRLRLFGGLCAALIHPRLRRLPLWTSSGRASAFSLRFSLVIAVELCMTLPMATYFHRATLLALPTNLLLVPVIAVLLALTILTFCTSLVSLSMARIPAACTAALIHLTRAVVSRTWDTSASPISAFLLHRRSQFCLRVRRLHWRAVRCECVLACGWRLHASH